MNYCLSVPEFSSLPKSLAPARRAKLPLIVEGVYFHPKYEELDFSLPQMLQILRNFEQGHPGYDVPVFVGHPQEHSSAPAVGFFSELFIEQGEDGKHRLYGICDFVDETTYLTVASGQFRSGSPELGPGFDKVTAEELGTVLYAHALTNVPYQPDMGSNRILSELNASTDRVFSYRTSEGTTMSDKSKAEPQVEAPQDENSQHTAVTVLSEAFQAYKAESEAKIAVLAQENADLKSLLAEATKEKVAAEMRTFADEVMAMPLPQTLKDKYVPQIREQKLSQAEAAIVMDSLRTFAEQLGTQVYSQQGTTAQSAVGENPYKQMIEQMKAEANAR